MKNILQIAALCLIATASSCQNKDSQTTPSSAGKINTTISVDDFQKKLAEDNQIQLVDVRTPEEYNGGHLKGAVNYNYNGSDFDAQLAKLDKNKPVLLYCLSGGRSAKAAALMGDKGFTAVYNMQGGIMKWKAADKPLDTNPAVATSTGMTLDEFNHVIVSDKDKYVLVDFNAKWCAPCKKMMPMLDSLETNKKDKLKLVKIDADANAALLNERKISDIPLLELYQNGKLIWTHKGLIDEATLLKETKL